MKPTSENLEMFLPKVRGRYLFDVTLASSTWFRVGGPAQVTFKPADVQDLCFFLQNRPVNLPVHVIGVGSNLLVRDGGVEGVVIRLGQGFTNMYVNETTIDVGAAVLDRNVAALSCEAGISGFEFLCGIPGTIGGALRMNAGAYGSEIAHILLNAIVVDPTGSIHRLTPQDLGLTYRHCDLPKDWIFIGASFKGNVGNTQEIEQKISTFLKERERTQPVKSQTGGSTFANPEGAKAWELIEKAGCRGLKKGGAMMSDLHCNFMLNTGGATAADLEALGEEVRQRVLEVTGVDLRWEIERIGIKDGSQIGEKAA
ncbi:MAG: UDP-N-acetylenolpyruvoylglucosamine reductase [Alphaproteobacteria bacterium 41-28]|nr:MAG: UDP-N-acetylenolpyruvoylglucosamine reductase [Alphaproteobacteria bacterium 41-28]